MQDCKLLLDAILTKIGDKDPVSKRERNIGICTICDQTMNIKSIKRHRREKHGDKEQVICIDYDLGIFMVRKILKAALPIRCM